LEDFPPADGWALSYALRGPGSLDVAATADGDGYAVAVAAAETAALPAGFYRWAAYVTSGAGERYEVETGALQVAPNFAASSDGRTRAERELAAVEDVLAGRISADVEHFMINGRQVARMPMAELTKMRGHLRAQVRRERTGRLGQRIAMTFRG
jgi:hypothetical protein